MAERYFYNKRVRNAPIRRRLDRRFLSWVMVSASVGAVVASGFVYSARCHFEAVELGYETQQRREELARREEQRRQLELELARTLSPDELERRARRIGLRAPEPPARDEKKDEGKAERKSEKRPSKKDGEKDGKKDGDKDGGKSAPAARAVAP
jgi:hypothetical protein